MQTILYELEM